jgi:pimeloyl-ACP methyl ester carboxylesterase
MLNEVTAGVLRIAYEQYGPPDGSSVILNHGFPYDVRAYDEVASILAERGCRVLVPYLRGYGPTRFRAAHTPRSGQQAALGTDLLAFMDGLDIGQAVLAGYDWGGRAACIVAALWPDRVRGLVSGLGYNIQDISSADVPKSPTEERQLWYQYYFHSRRGHLGLDTNRYEFCKLLWQLWSPTWDFSETTYARSADSFDNPDFTAVVIHSYRHRFGLVAGDPDLEDIERELATLPPISVPTVAMYGTSNSFSTARQDDEVSHFTGPYRRMEIPGAGHNLPQEAPQEFAEEVVALL